MTIRRRTVLPALAREPRWRPAGDWPDSHLAWHPVGRRTRWVDLIVRRQLAARFPAPNARRRAAAPSQPSRAKPN